MLCLQRPYGCSSSSLLAICGTANGFILEAERTSIIALHTSPCSARARLPAARGGAAFALSRISRLRGHYRLTAALSKSRYFICSTTPSARSRRLFDCPCTDVARRDPLYVDSGK
ncbi:hypothetical protein EVAR_4244_1 [Eumeta japonica]|uniref:Uncharacterized protein n=1 Tax=Eumeta variegata TaxID=151549 RepID=A0A4C1TG64_EUMVA|nr:hypothetical protein EVAR_4244_1 [Eumeta japonica]